MPNALCKHAISFTNWEQNGAFVYHLPQNIFLSYTVVEDNSASGEVTVQYGLKEADTIGKLLVLHDQSGARISCTVIEAPRIRINF